MTHPPSLTPALSCLTKEELLAPPPTLPAQLLYCAWLACCKLVVSDSHSAVFAASCLQLVLQLVRAGPEQQHRHHRGDPLTARPAAKASNGEADADEQILRRDHQSLREC